MKQAGVTAAIGMALALLGSQAARSEPVRMNVPGLKHQPATYPATESNAPTPLSGPEARPWGVLARLAGTRWLSGDEETLTIIWTQNGRHLLISRRGLFGYWEQDVSIDPATGALRFERDLFQGRFVRGGGTVETSKGGFSMTWGAPGARMREACKLAGADLQCVRSAEIGGKWQESRRRMLFTPTDTAHRDAVLRYRNEQDYFPDLMTPPIDAGFGDLAGATGVWRETGDGKQIIVIDAPGGRGAARPGDSLRFSLFSTQDRVESALEFRVAPGGEAKAELVTVVNPVRRKGAYILEPVKTLVGMSVDPAGGSVICAAGSCSSYRLSASGNRLLRLTTDSKGKQSLIWFRRLLPTTDAAWGPIALMDGKSIAAGQPSQGGFGMNVFRYSPDDQTFRIRRIDPDGRLISAYGVKRSADPSIFNLFKIDHGVWTETGYLRVAGPTSFDWISGSPGQPVTSALRVDAAATYAAATRVSYKGGVATLSKATDAFTVDAYHRAWITRAQRLDAAANAKAQAAEQARKDRAARAAEIWDNIGGIFEAAAAYRPSEPTFQSHGYTFTQSELDAYEVRKRIYGDGSGSGSGDDGYSKPAKPKPAAPSPTRTLYISCWVPTWDATKTHGTYHASPVMSRQVVEDQEATEQDRKQRITRGAVQLDIDLRWKQAMAPLLGHPGGGCDASYSRQQIEETRARQMEGLAFSPVAFSPN